jgi:hypothetical protein
MCGSCHATPLRRVVQGTTVAYRKVRVYFALRVRRTSPGLPTFNTSVADLGPLRLVPVRQGPTLCFATIPSRSFLQRVRRIPPRLPRCDRRTTRSGYPWQDGAKTPLASDKCCTSDPGHRSAASSKATKRGWPFRMGDRRTGTSRRPPDTRSLHAGRRSAQFSAEGFAACAEGFELVPIP